MKYILGIDIGTGSAKAVALNLANEPIGTCQHHYPTDAPIPGYSEQDPELIWKAFTACILEMREKMGDSPIAIGLSSAMHSLICVDDQGMSLAPMITWADARSADIAVGIRNSDEGMNIYEATGMPVHAMSPLCKLVWLRENKAVLFHRTHKFISIKEYIWYRLFKEFKIDHSIASCTGLFDLKQLNWNKASLLLTQITAEKLSEPVSTSYSKKGLTTFGTDLSMLFEDTVFVIGASDGCLANIGSDANKPGIAALTIGTSGAVRISSPTPIFNREAMTFSYVLDEHTYICGGPVNNGGIALQWLLKNFMGKADLSAADYETLFAQVASVSAGSKGLLFLPYLTGERAPIWDAESCGTFFGLRLHHDQAHFCRAVIEGICYALNDVLMAVEQHAAKISQINVSGGFVHSRIWMEILADITGKEIVLVQTEDASAIGAAYLAIRAIGGTNLQQAYPVSPGTNKETIKPNPENHIRYVENFKLFRQLYVDLKDSMHKLHQLNAQD